MLKILLNSLFLLYNTSRGELFMKKKLLFVFLMILLILPINVFADTIKKLDMKIYLDNKGNADITEYWYVKASGGSEWYKAMYNLGLSEITDFKVSMDGTDLKQKDWDVSESMSEKAGYYGIVNNNNGVELCFGKQDFNDHTFILTYKVSNFVFKTQDSQVLYWTLIPKITVDNFTVELSSYYSFPDTLDVWGYGYKGYAYVEDGKIKMSNEGNLNDDYVVLLAKFPIDTFKTTYVVSGYNVFEDVLNQAEEGSYKYDYSQKRSFLSFIINFIPLIIVAIIVMMIIFYNKKNKYGYKNNKKIVQKDVPFFRDIPCNKDIYYANILIKLNGFSYYSQTNIFGSIILKWVKENKVKFLTSEEGIFNKKTSSIDLRLNPTFDNSFEKKLFDVMYEASNDGILENKELEKWCRKNYNKFFNIFSLVENDEINKLKSDNSIYQRTSKEECKYFNVMSDKLYNDSVELCGLKKFLEEFSRMDTKEVLEVHLWDEYLMFAYLFGIADKVAKQLKNLYPEVIEQNDFDYDTIILINSFTRSSVSAASSARSAAENYTAGGGGFSSGGGGGGSFGGGGSAGGR